MLDTNWALAEPDAPSTASSAGQATQLYTISAGGFSATVDAFARDEQTEGLWFLSMLGSQTAVKAIWATLLKQPPEAAFLIQGADGLPHSGGYQRCLVPEETIGTWTTKIARLPSSGGWQAMVYTKLADFRFERDEFLLFAPDEEAAPALHRRFLDRRSDLPLRPEWADWLWRTGLRQKTIVPLESVGVAAYKCQPNHELLREELSQAVASGRLALPKHTESPITNGGSR